MSDTNTTQTNIPNPNKPAGNAPPVTQAEVMATVAGAPAEAVSAAMGAAAPATPGQMLESHTAALASLDARVQQVEGVIGVVAPIAQTFAGLIPGVGPEIETGLGLVPTLVNSFNALLAEIQQAFSGKVAGGITPVALPAPPSTPA